MSRFPTLAAIASISLLAGCSPVDHSGGPPPDGDALAFAIIDDGPGLVCGTYEDRADLIADEAAVDAWIESCESAEEGDRDDLIAVLNELNADESLVLVTVALGGCLGQTNLQSVHLDGDVVRPWLLKADSAYGRNDIACTADIGEQIYVVAVADEQASTSAEVHVGVYNPELPDAPVVDQE